MTAKQPDLSALLNELKQEYLANLPHKIAKIKDLYAHQQVSALRDEFHKLKGTGKTYGFPEISELSEAVEKLCETRQSDLIWVIPTAVNVLQKIYVIHQSKVESRVDQDADFIRIRMHVASI